MNNLGEYLEKFKKFLSGPKLQREEVLKAIKKVAGIELAEGDIEIKEGTVYVASSPAVRNELFMRKANILAELGISLDSKAPRNIR